MDELSGKLSSLHRQLDDIRNSVTTPGVQILHQYLEAEMQKNLEILLDIGCRTQDEHDLLTKVRIYRSILGLLKDKEQGVRKQIVDLQLNSPAAKREIELLKMEEKIRRNQEWFARGNDGNKQGEIPTTNQ